MTDIHCHILPDIDDGADSLQTALMMAAQAADDGITKIIATPHINWSHRYSGNSFDKVRDTVKQFQDELYKAGIPIKIITGAEVLMVEIAEEKLQAGLFPKIEGTDYALVEFSFKMPFETMLKYLEALKNVDILPIVAHPERYTDIQNHKKYLKTLAENGYYIQINKGSAWGLFGRKAFATAKWALKHGLVAVIASDAHNTDDRTTKLYSTYRMLAKKFGDEYIDLITRTNQHRLLENKPMIVNIK